MQVASRLFLVWAVVQPFADQLSLADSVAFRCMVVAWSITEIVRYSFYAVPLWFGCKNPGWLTWCRYAISIHSFYLLVLSSSLVQMFCFSLICDCLWFNYYCLCFNCYRFSLICDCSCFNFDCLWFKWTWFDCDRLCLSFYLLFLILWW
jgi:hypothetical protein